MTRITHPINPTQFYDIEPKNAMILRSGKKINCMLTTDFYRETQLMLSAFRLMDYVEYDGFTTQSEFQDWTADVICENMWQKEFNYITKNAGEYCIQCTRLILLDNYFKKWRSTINIYHELGLKSISIYKIRVAIEFLKTLQQEGTYQFCGCTDHRRRDLEDDDWHNYITLGPGRMEEVPNVQGIAGETILTWVQTPEVSPEEFERQMKERITWRHDLCYLLESFQEHLAYLELVPHKIYQDMYFKISRAINQDCAKLVLSFL